MGCTACAKKKSNSYQDFKVLESPPYRATDIIVYDLDTNQSRKFIDSDWNTSITNVLLFIPSLEALKELEELAPKEGVKYTYVTSQPVHQIKDYIEHHDITFIHDRIFSTYLLPSRMNLLHNGFTKKAVAYILPDGDMAIQNYFYNSTFNYNHIKAFLDDYSNDSN